jgi:hypothetical protein
MARARCQRGVMGVVDIALASILPARCIYVLSLCAWKIRVSLKGRQNRQAFAPTCVCPTSFQPHRSDKWTTIPHAGTFEGFPSAKC